MNIFVGNLSATVTAEDLRRLFAGHGTIINAIIMRDVDTGLPLGYGHVYLLPEQAAHAAIVKLDKTILKGNTITVRECLYRAPRERRAAESYRHTGFDQASSAATGPRNG